VPTVREQVDLSGYTTLRLGGPAERFVEADTVAAITGAVTGADLAGECLLVLGGGSNLVVAEEGFPGTVVRIGTTGLRPGTADPDRVLLTVAAGEDWDRLVEWAVSEKLAGLECLAGIPGLAGATPIQNVGAYGQEVATTIEAVTVFDRADRSVATFGGPECGFGYRTSLFKAARMPGRAGPGGHSAGRGLSRPGTPQTPMAPGPRWPGTPRGAGPTGRYVVLDVTFSLRRALVSEPVRYAELAAVLGVAVGDRAPLAEVRSAVLGLRRRKGMVLDPADKDTASAGSFFTNPVLRPEQLAGLERAARARDPGASVPRFPAEDGLVKVPAAWLIEQAGFGKGYPGGGAARISSKHTLALTNQGGARTSELIDLARQIAAGVRAAFDIELISEPVLVGVTL
jgi:UDP-N-acetylmuramate dehydrogenase